MNWRMCFLISAALSMFGVALEAQTPPGKAAGASSDDSEARPPVTQADVRIVQRAKEILNSPAVWNRADNRVCPAAAKTFSLYCALEKATDEVSGHFEHRGAAMQEARFVIEDMRLTGRSTITALWITTTTPEPLSPISKRCSGYWRSGSRTD
jgi:hypothetical protein